MRTEALIRFVGEINSLELLISFLMDNQGAIFIVQLPAMQQEMPSIAGSIHIQPGSERLLDNIQ
ncbi:hypothetical protein NDA01_31055, partial [Trichocoleus desertorum AS-A10]|uniref:hypothetical protein n=1 Tax=Trichocoleus desertorum TaxID=1481672 RepID=UPI003296E6C5